MRDVYIGETKSERRQKEFRKALLAMIRAQQGGSIGE